MGVKRMSVGTSDCTIVVDRSRKRMYCAGTNWFMQALDLDITGHDYAVGNLLLLAYRGSTIVAMCDEISGTSADATGILDTATEEMQTAISDADTQHGEIMKVDLRLWDTNSLELLAEGSLDIRGIIGSYTTSPVTPISATTVFWGDLCSFGGKTYLKNNEDGLWYPFSLRGTGETVHYTVDETAGLTDAQIGA